MKYLNNGHVWIGTNDARVLKLPKDNPFSARLIAQLPGAEVHDIQEDNEGNIWVGNSGGGLFRFGLSWCSWLDLFSPLSHDDNGPR